MSGYRKQTFFFLTLFLVGFPGPVQHYKTSLQNAIDVGQFLTLSTPMYYGPVMEYLLKITKNAAAEQTLFQHDQQLKK